jgi:hypothetical protein
MTRCPECGGPVLRWPDGSGGVTINFRCENIRCGSGKGPWDADPPAEIEQRGPTWFVRYHGIVVGTHEAKHKARDQANSLNGPIRH